MTTTAETRRSVTTIGGAIKRMRALNDFLPEEDGLRQFNVLYTEITVAVADGLRDGQFRDGEFMEVLDVAFANRYFGAIRTWGRGNQARVPRIWAALFEQRANREIAPIQFAAAGVNAHINHDLAVALVKAGQQRRVPLKGGARHHDYLEINKIFDERYEGLRRTFLPDAVDRFDHGLLTLAANIASKIVVTVARDKAWERALKIERFLGDGNKAAADAIIAESDDGRSAHLILADLHPGTREAAEAPHAPPEGDTPSG